ncbi:MAG TPA: glycosyltransferase family 4 protein [Thermomicrobiales bacterium]|nr:glycosyltransferase family 4 protein [Thermomicrobiales bacterium]
MTPHAPRPTPHAPRLAVFTPLPPSPSGIAQYSAELLPLLAEWATLDVVIADDAPAPEPMPDWATVRRAGEFNPEGYDALVYQVGNSPAHAHAIAWAEREPGVLVLHDVVLQHVQGWRALRGGAAAYRAEMARRYGAAGAAAADALLANRPAGAPPGAFPLSEALVEASRAAIVHSRYARDLVLARTPGAAVTVVPHGVPLPPPGDRAAARAALGLSAGAFVVAALGHLIPEKRLDVALDAFARVLYGLPAAREACFVIAGAPSPHYSPAAYVRAHGLDPVVRQPGAVDAATFAALLAAADLCVNLRWPTGGETSGSLLRMLAAGRATLVSDAGSFAEVPDDACVKIPVGAGEVEAVVAALWRAARDPAWAAGIGARARDFVAREHSLARAAAGYRAVLAAAGAAGT